jgi:hypothetical protein
LVDFLAEAQSGVHYTWFTQPFIELLSFDGVLPTVDLLGNGKKKKRPEGRWNPKPPMGIEPITYRLRSDCSAD